MLQGSFTFKGISLRTAYLDLAKITLENGTAVAEYRVYADKAAFEADKTQYLTTHSESFPYTTKQIQTLLDNGIAEAKKEGKVDEVRMTNRLTDSPAWLVAGAHDMDAQMKKIMEAAGQPVPESKPSFELNPEHPLVAQLNNEQDDERFNDLTLVLFDQAALAMGDQLKEPGAFVNRLNKLLLDLSK